MHGRGAGAAAGLAMAASTSSLSIWPRLPEPFDVAGARPALGHQLLRRRRRGHAVAARRRAAAGAAATAGCGGAGLGLRCRLGRRRQRRRRSPMAPISAPTLTVSPGLAAIDSSTPADGRRHLDGHLVGLELDHRLVGGDGVAHLLEPLADRRLGDALAQRGHPDVSRHQFWSFSLPLSELSRGEIASSRKACICCRCVRIRPVAVEAEAGRPT